MFAVYRVMKNGSHRYVARSVTHSEKLAQDIADYLSRGEFVRPDGSIGHCRAYPHIAKPVSKGN